MSLPSRFRPIRWWVAEFPGTRAPARTTRQAHCLGYAVHIWTNGDQDETDAAYERFYNSGADGVMT